MIEHQSSQQQQERKGRHGRADYAPDSHEGEQEAQQQPVSQPRRPAGIEHTRQQPDKPNQNHGSETPLEQGFARQRWLGED